MYKRQAITITGTLEVTSGSLIIDPGSINNSGLLVASAGTMQIDDTPVINTGELLATAGGTLILNGETVTNTGTVEVDAGPPVSTLDLETATISGSIVNVYGILDSFGTSAINGGAAITIASTGTLEAITGTLTIDPSSINNAGKLAADGGALNIDNVTSFTNSGTLLATAGVTLVLSADTVSGTGTVEVDTGTPAATLNFEGSSISGGTVTVDGLFNSTGTSSISDAAITIASTGTLESVSYTHLVWQTRCHSERGRTCNVSRHVRSGG